MPMFSSFFLIEQDGNTVRTELQNGTSEQQVHVVFFVCFFFFIRLYISIMKECDQTHLQTLRKALKINDVFFDLFNFEVFGNMIKHCLKCLIFLLN